MAIFLFVYIFIAYLLIFAAIIILAQIPLGESTAGFLPLTLPFTIATVVAVMLAWIAGRVFENLPFRALGISFRGHWLGHFAGGCVVGAIAMSSAVIVAMMTGGLTLAVNRTSAGSTIAFTLLTTIVIFAVGAASEETLFRGYLLQTFVRSRMVPVGVVLTSLLFAFAHNNNPDVGGLALLNTLLAGVWFAAAYLKTRDLWFPLGVHFMWNWLQGPVFGINVSGIAEFSPDPILRATDAGPVWLTGGSYGIEGGVACTFALVLSMGLIYFLPIKSEPIATENGGTQQ